MLPFSFSSFLLAPLPLVPSIMEVVGEATPRVLPSSEAADTEAEDIALLPIALICSALDYFALPLLPFCCFPSSRFPLTIFSVSISNSVVVCLVLPGV